MNITLIGNSILRQAIQNNFVSFPSQIPAFVKRRAGEPAGQLHTQRLDKEERIAHLYFMSNWRVTNICDRYGMSKQMVRKVLTEWRIRAVSGGYVQDIDPDSLDRLIRAYEEREHAAMLQAVPPRYEGVGAGLTAEAHV